MKLEDFKKLSIQNILNKILSKNNFPKLVFIIGLVGLSLICLPNFSLGKTKKAEINSDTQFISEQRRKKLEENLENIISEIQGAGKSKVLVTLENGAETVYATEERKNKEASEDKSSGEITRKKESDDCEKKFITIKDSEGTEHALAVTEIEPKVKGVVIICPGGDDIVVKKRIVDATTTALNINSTRVCVTKSG